MGEAGGALCFAMKAHQKGGVHDIFAAQRLDGHQAPQCHILGPVDFGQTALAKFGQDLITIVEYDRFSHVSARPVAGVGCIVHQNGPLSKRLALVQQFSC